MGNYNEVRLEAYVEITHNYIKSTVSDGKSCPDCDKRQSGGLYCPDCGILMIDVVREVTHINNEEWIDVVGEDTFLSSSSEDKTYLSANIRCADYTSGRFLEINDDYISNQKDEFRNTYKKEIASLEELYNVKLDVKFGIIDRVF